MADNKLLRIGSGAAWWGDRVEPAQLNAERGDLDYLCFETMAEATVSAAQVRARRRLGWIVTAHTADDAAETLLMRLISNKEPRGIEAMDCDRRLLRPLPWGRPPYPRATPFPSIRATRARRSSCPCRAHGRRRRHSR